MPLFRMITTRCMVCEQARHILNEPEQHACSICGSRFEAHHTCPDGHYVCQSCREAKAREQMIRYCLKSERTDLYKLVVELMKLSTILMHGPEHHFLLTAAMLTVHNNQTRSLNLADALDEANRRSMQVPGASCAQWGVCGAAIGAGIFASIITQATPLSVDEWKITGQLTARCADSISKRGGPRCCKRDTFISMRKAVAYCNENLGTGFVLPETIKCGFFDANEDCKGKHCEFFPQKKPWIGRKPTPERSKQ